MFCFSLVLFSLANPGVQGLPKPLFSFSFLNSILIYWHRLALTLNNNTRFFFLSLPVNFLVLVIPWYNKNTNIMWEKYENNVNWTSSPDFHIYFILFSYFPACPFHIIFIFSGTCLFWPTGTSCKLQHRISTSREVAVP